MRIKQDKRAVSNVIVIVLGLVIITVIVSNVFLWNYEMNQLDWERIREDVKITSVTNVMTRSSWFVTKGEYKINVGSKISGTYEDTQAANDGCWETFREELSSPPPKYMLHFNGTFIIDVSAYPLATIQTVEIQLRYNASDTEEKWYLKAYNWATGEYSDSDFNTTSGSQPSAAGEWVSYAVNLTDQWRSYVRDDGTMYIKIHDEIPEPPGPPSGVHTTISVDFLAVRAVGSWALFTFRNDGPLTSHLVSLWIINSTHHRRYDIDLIINSGQILTYPRFDISLPSGEYIVKVATERGNIATYPGS